MDIKTLYQKFIDECGQQIATDSSADVVNSMFFAMRGDNFNGNAYAQMAIDAGAQYIVLDDEQYYNADDERHILVVNVLQTLQELARHHRMQFDVPVVGLTGSNGKTTTKELLRDVLSTEELVVATEGNLNNHIGVPLTLLGISNQTTLVIVEMGANHVGEIKKLCEIAMPTHGIITNIGRAHIGLFGGIEGVIRAKTELYRHINDNNGELFVNADDPLLVENAFGIEQTVYGNQPEYDAQVTTNRTLPFVSVHWKDQNIQTKLTGEYNVQNIAAAICMGDYFAISRDHIAQAISGYRPTNSRSEIAETEQGNFVIKDFYNANQTSMEAALRNLSDIETDQDKVAILGHMFDLGEYSKEDHAAVAQLSIDLGFTTYLVGPDFDIDTPGVTVFETTDDAIEAFRDIEIQDSYVLLKASNGTNFKKLFSEVRL